MFLRALCSTNYVWCHVIIMLAIVCAPSGGVAARFVSSQMSALSARMNGGPCRELESHTHFTRSPVAHNTTWLSVHPGIILYGVFFWSQTNETILCHSLSGNQAIVCIWRRTDSCVSIFDRHFSRRQHFGDLN